jgi:hypothetical protein
MKLTFHFPRYDLLLKEGTIILKLQGFGVVSIIGLNPDLIRVSDLALLIIHIGMYTKVQIWLKIRHGVRSWATIDKHHHRYYFFFVLVQFVNY